MKKISPLKIFLIYWIFTLILYAYGPFKWVTNKPLLFWSLNIVYLFLFCIGWSICRKVNTGGKRRWTDQDEKKLLRRLGPLLCINLLYEVVNVFRMFLFSSFDVPGLIRRIMSGISNMGGSYNSFQDNVNITSANVVGGSIVTIFNYIWDIWSFSTLLFGILYFKKLKLHQKIISGVTVFIEVIVYISRGTNIGVFRIVLAVLVFYYIKYIRNNTSWFNKIKKKTTKLVLLGTVGVVLVVFLFDKIMKSRGGITLWQAGTYNIGGIYINNDSVFFKILPSSFHQLLVSLAGYLSQGYYGMSLALKVPWEPMWGVGHSMALQNLLGNVFSNISNASYQVRIEQFGWDSYTQWHTMYSWFANDISFYGVPIIMFLFGYVFHKALRDTIELNNPYAKLMLYYMFLMAVFLPCNNQLAQSSYILFSFFYVFIQWQLSKRYSA